MILAMFDFLFSIFISFIDIFEFVITICVYIIILIGFLNRVKLLDYRNSTPKQYIHEFFWWWRALWDNIDE